MTPRLPAGPYFPIGHGLQSSACWRPVTALYRPTAHFSHAGARVVSGFVVSAAAYSPLPHTLAIADKGWEVALREDRHLAEGLNVWNGHVTYKAVAEDLGYVYMSAAEILGVKAEG